MHIFITKWNGGHELIEAGGSSGLTLAFLLSPLTFHNILQVTIFLPPPRESNDSVKEPEGTVDSK